MKKWLVILFLSIFFIFMVIYFTPISIGKLLISLNDGTTAKNITFSSAQNHIFNLTLPKNATVITAILNLSGFATSTITSESLFVVDTNTVSTSDYVFNYSYTSSSLTYLTSTSVGVKVTNGEGITFNGSDFWIVDDADDNIEHYDSSFTFIDTINLYADNIAPRGITYNSTHLFVVDQQQDLVYIYLKNGTYISSWGVSSNVTTPTSIENNGTHFWIYDSNDDLIYYYLWDGTLIGNNGNFVPSDNSGPYMARLDESTAFFFDSSPLGTNKYAILTGSLIQNYAYTSSNDAPKGMDYHSFVVSSSSNSSNITLDVTNDGDIEFNHSGTFNTINQTNDFSGELNAYLSTCTAVNGNCTIPINISSGSAGIVQIDAINIVYLIPTAPSLVSPLNNTYHKDNVSFNCSANSDTDPLKNISLWTNITGTWKENISTIKTGTSNYSNWTLWNIPEGIFIYNCLATNQNGSNWTSAFASNNLSFIVDVTNPNIGQSGLNDTLPQINDNIQFYQNFSDLYQLDFYIFSWNGTGTWTNFTVDISTQNHSAVQNRTLTVGRSNIVNYYFWVNDSSGNININNTGTIIVNNTYPTFIQSLTSQSVKTPNSLNYDVNCTDADSDTISYTDNSTLFVINSATGVISDTPDETENSTTNINITCHDGFNNNSQQFNYMIGDGTPPSFSSTQNSTPSTYSNTLSFFNITITSNNGGVNKSFISNNFTGTWKNSTINNTGSNIYTYNETLGAGSFSYRYWMNDSYNNINFTNIFNFTINKITSSCSLSLVTPITFGIQSQINCSCNNPELNASLYRNDTNVSYQNGTFTTLSAGTHSYVCNISQSANYTSATTSNSLVVNKAGTIANISLNNEENNSILTYGQTLTAIYNWVNLSANMFRNGTNINSENNTAKILVVGFYNYTAIINTTQNYTGMYKEFNVTVNRNTSSILILFNGTNQNLRVNYTYGSVNITGRLITGESNITLWRNSTLLLNRSSEFMWVENLTILYSNTFCANYSITQNYSSSSNCSTLTVVDEMLPSIYNNVTGGSFKRYTNFTANITLADFSLNFTWFSTNNSGIWVNDTPMSIGGLASYTLNNSKNISIGYPNNICWKVYVNDSSNNINTSITSCFDVVDTTSTFSSPINGSPNFRRYENFTANITLNDVDGINYTLFSTNATGSWVNDTWVNLNGAVSYRFNNSKNISLAYPNTIGWIVYTNSTGNVITNSSIYVFNVVNTIPTHSTPILNTSYGSNYTNETLYCINQSTNDNDNHSVVNNYKWFKNGVVNASRWINDSSLVLYLPFDGNTTQDYALGNDVYYNNATYNNSGKINGAYQFDGASNTYLNISLINTNTSNFKTISFWYKNYNSSSGEHLFSDWQKGISYGRQGSNDIQIYVNNGSIRCPFRNIIGYNGNEYIYEVLVFNLTNLSIYRNGILNSSYVNSSCSAYTYSNNLFLGYSPLDSNFMFNGSIDELMIFNRSLSQSEISQIYYATKDGYGVLNDSQTTAGDNWTCEMQPFDPYDAGTPLNTTQLSILNYPSYFTSPVNGSNDWKRYSNFTANITINEIDGLYSAIFSTNASGTWVNTSTLANSLTTYNFNRSANITIPYPNNICWLVYSNDSVGNITNSSPYCFNVVDTITYFTNNITGGNLKFNTNFTANITINDVDGLNFTWFSSNASGTWTNDTPIAISGLSTYVFNNSKNITLTRGNSICWRVYANDTSGSSNNTINLCFDVNNTEPTVASATINDTSADNSDDLYCNNGTTNDIDGDAITLFYDWLNGTISKNINNPMLGSGNTSVNDSWFCRIWAGDTFNNGTNITSGSISIGTGYITPIINFTNATTTNTNIQSNSINPTNNNSWINLSVNFTDVNSDKWTAHFCSSNFFDGANCTATTLCSSLVNQSTTLLSCIYNTTNLARGSYNYYVYIIDNTSQISSSKSGSYKINVHPTIPILSFPSNNSFITKNYTWLNYSSSDLDGDAITYFIYTNNTGSFTLIYNGTNMFFNYTNLNENRSIHWFASARDNYNYTSENSTQFILKTDYTAINATINFPVNGTTYSDSAYPITVPHNFTISDTDYSVCYYNVTLSTGGFVISNTDINCTNPPTGFNISISATNMTYSLFINDTANNVATYQRLIHTSISTSSPGGGGGGGGGVVTECYVDEDCEIYGSLYYCKNYKCVVNGTQIKTIEPSCGDGVCQPEFGEDIIQCSQDCPLQKSLLSSCFDKDISNDTLCFLKQRWFFVLVTLLGLIGLVYLFVSSDKKRKRRFEL